MPAPDLDSSGYWAVATTFQLVFAFLATYGLASADWGAACPSPREARVGGLVGVMLAAPILSIIGMLIVAGSMGREIARSPQPEFSTNRPRLSANRPPLRGMKAAPEPEAPPGPRAVSVGGFTLREVYFRRVGGAVGGTALLVLALGLLGPACYAPFTIARQFSPIRPAIPGWAWSLLGAVAGWPLIASGLAGRTDILFGLIGALTAPAVGAMAGDSIRHRRGWPGPTLGVNLAGMIAWAVGVGVGLIPTIGRIGGLPTLTRAEPAAVFAFLAAFAANLVLGLLRWEPRRLAIGPARAESGG